MMEDDFPEINRLERVATEHSQMNKRTLIHRHKTQLENTHMMKSNQSWQKKQDACFQQAMEKVHKIMNARIKVTDKFRSSSKLSQ